MSLNSADHLGHLSDNFLVWLFFVCLLSWPAFLNFVLQTSHLYSLHSSSDSSALDNSKASLCISCQWSSRLSSFKQSKSQKQHSKSVTSTSELTSPAAIASPATAASTGSFRASVATGLSYCLKLLQP